MMINIPEEIVREICAKYNSNNGIFTAVYASPYAIELRDRKKTNVLHLYEFIFERKYMFPEIVFPHKERFLEEFAISKKKGAYLAMLLNISV